MKETDDTEPPNDESEVKVKMDFADLLHFCAGFNFEIKRMKTRVTALEAEVADLHHRRRVSRQQATDQDPEWH